MSYTKKDLNSWTVLDLKKLATEQNITGRSKLTKKDELINTIVKMNKSNNKSKQRIKNVDEKQIVSIGHAAMRGRRNYMEDTFIINTQHRSKWKIFGVFDGHGGKEISKSLCDEKRGIAAYLIPKLIKTELRDIPSVIIDSMVSYDKKLFREHGTKIESGSTCILLILSPDYEYGWFVNVGDSRGVWYSINGYIRQKTIDHKPRDPEELQRISNAGGYIENDEGTWRVDGILALSRAFGDFHLKTNTEEKRDYEDGRVSSVPDVIPLNLNSMQSDVFVLASDGLWDEMNNRDVGGHIKTFGVSNASSKALIQKAYDIGSDDNITVLMIQLDFPNDL